MMTIATRQQRIRSAAERYAQTARRAGVPAGQLRRFVAGGYVAQPKQLQFHALARTCDVPGGPVEIGFGGARGPGKTHAAFAQVALDDCQRYPGLKFLFLRKIGKAAKESVEDLRRSVLRATPHEFKRQEGVIEFPNGSRIVLGHFNNENDIDNYIGVEYDGAAIEEANTLSKEKHRALGGSIRSSKPGWRPRQYLTFNPGGAGHQYIRERFIQPYRRNTQSRTRFIPAFYTDNVHLNPEYREYLEQLGGALGQLWRDGDWDAAGGQFFSQWRYELHTADDVRIAAHWRTWLAMDYGWSHYTAIYLLAEDDLGRVYVADEHGAQRWLINQHAAAVDEMLARHELRRHRIETFVAGGDCFTPDSHGNTIAAQWAGLGWTLAPAATNRIAGAATITQRLGNPAASVPPTLAISRRCANLTECIPALLSDPKRPEDVLKVDTDSDGEGGDDWYDAFRYGVMAAGGSRWSAADLGALAGQRRL